MKLFRNLGLSVAGILGAMLVQGCATTPDNTVRTSKEPYFSSATETAKAPDSDGFLQRWLLLEPIKNSLRSNAGFTETFIRNSFSREYFTNQFSVIPRDGDTVTVEGERLKWHALDAVNFNVKLFRFATGQAGVWRYLLGGHCDRQSAGNEKRAFGRRLELGVNVVVERRRGRCAFRRQTDGHG